VAIYTRVSTLSQVGGRFDSCASQEAICRDYIASRAGDGWFEIACYTDAAYSGADMDRPGIRALKHQIVSGDIKVVLVFKIERLLRCVDEWSSFRIFLRQHGCSLISTSENLCEATPSGRLKNNIMVSVAEYERLNTGVKVRAKMLEQAKRGYWNYGAVPFGYEYDSEKQLLCPHPTEAHVARGIFEDAANGLSIKAIVERLAAVG
jgi:DNA invertase Pin-like site-specific DNA recombinase